MRTKRSKQNRAFLSGTLEISILAGAVLLSASCSEQDHPTYEKRILEIEHKLSSMPRLPAWNVGGTVGYRSDFFNEAEPADPPSLTIDLGSVQPVDMAALIPARLFYASTTATPFGVPQRFRILGARDELFTEPIVLADCTREDFTDSRGYPMLVALNGPPVRYVRIELLRLTGAGELFVAALAEIIIFNDLKNVSVDRPVTATHAYSLGQVFRVQYAVDGNTPFGLPEYPLQNRSPVGWSTGKPVDSRIQAMIEIRLARPETVDTIRLCTAWTSLYQSEPGVYFPQHIQLAVPDKNQPDGWAAVLDRSPLLSPGGSPAIFHFPPATSDRFRIRCWRANPPFSLRLSEIELLSNGTNVALQAAAHADLDENNADWNASALTDGYSSTGHLISDREWVKQLALRGLLEKERDCLRTQIEQRVREDMRTLRRSLTGLAILALAAVTAALVTRRNRRRQIEQLRHEISSDLHDEIGSNLASISFLGEYLRTLVGEEEKARDAVKELVEISRETSEAMKDIVWMLHPLRKQSEGFAVRLREITERLLRGLDFTADISGLGTQPDWKIDRLRHFILFYKEALHNLRKHSGASQVSITITRKPGTLTLTIRDNGRLFKGPLSAALRERARNLGGTLACNCGESNNVLQLDIPVTRNLKP